MGLRKVRRCPLRTANSVIVSPFSRFFLRILQEHEPVCMKALFAILPLKNRTGGFYGRVAYRDGHRNTVDAIASHQAKERRFGNWKDPPCGMFAIMGSADLLCAVVEMDLCAASPGFLYHIINGLYVHGEYQADTVPVRIPIQAGQAADLFHRDCLRCLHFP